MKKNILTTFLFTILVLNASLCLAQGTYVRKKISPNVYVPKSALDKSEKLPEFYYPTQNNLRESIEELQDREVTHVEVKTEVVKTEKIIKKQTPAVSEIEQTEYNNKFSEILSLTLEDEEPLYTKKFDEYISDISILTETGKMPENTALEDDLSVMNSNQKKKI